MRLFPLIAFLSAALLARADEPPIIAKARAYLGSEDALGAVQSVHLVGGFVSMNAGAAMTQPESSVDIIFQRPWQHHLVVTAVQTVKPSPPATGPEQKSTVVRTIALNGYDAWERVQVNSNLPQLGLLSIDQIRVLRADVWENLGYYRGLEAEGGRVEDQGAATMDGVACEKIAFIHSPAVVYYRYFDQATGRLVYTETAGGLQIREEGTIVADGIKFPQKITTIESPKTANGLQRSTTLTLDRITVNETFPESLFAVPLPPVPTRPAVSAAISLPAPAAPAAAAPAGTP